MWSLGVVGQGKSILNDSYQFQCEFHRWYNTLAKQPKTHTIPHTNGLSIGHTTPPLTPGNGYWGTQHWQRIKVFLNMWTDFTGILRNKGKTNTYTHSCTAGKYDEFNPAKWRKCQILSVTSYSLVEHRIFNFYILFQQSCSDFQGVWLLQLNGRDYEWFAWGTFPGKLYKLTKTSEIVSVFSVSQ